MPQVSGLAARPQVMARPKPAGWPKHVDWAGNRPRQPNQTGKDAARKPQDGVVVKIIEARAPADRAIAAAVAETGGQVAQTSAVEGKASAAARRPEPAVGPYGAFFDWLFNQR